MKTIKYEDLTNLLTINNYNNNIPGTGFFELTPLCNLDCKMCYVHLNDPSVKNKMLSGAQWIAIMQEAIEHGMTRACLSGGEAMTHPDFLDIYMFLINNGIAVQLKTNGILLDQMMDVFKKYPPVIIDVSLYGCDSESYLAVTGVDAHERVVSNIQKVIDNGLSIRLMITPSEQMFPYIEKVMRLADSFGVSVIITEFLLNPNDNTGRSKESFAISDNAFEEINRLKDEIFDPKDIARDEYEPDDSAEIKVRTLEKGLRCLAGRGTFAINWDGTMSPCVNFPRTIVLAEPMKTGFADAWKKINESVRNYEWPKKCHSCDINSRCNFCPVKHSKVIHLHQCDETVCNFVRSKINRKMKG